ncbi:MAG: SDR family oxidoreductase [Gammaproteobacteria bacterium]|nr:SDR family oxidoreductase [Gammaproteobacteria bacterium]
MDVYEKSEVVVITGASAGVGRATARAFAKHGAHIGLIARDTARLEAARGEVEALGGKALAVSVDVADAAALERAAETIESNLGEIDIWINAAMTTIVAPLAEIEPGEFKRVSEVTYLGNVYGTMAALKRMLPRNRGTIVQVSSALAYHSVPLQAPYCGAKHAINGYTDSLRAELLHRGSHVHVTAVDLPGLNTPQFDWALNKMPQRLRPVAPVYQPEVAARAIVWAAHHRRARLYVGLSALLMIWADKFAPGLLDRYMARSAVSGQQTAEPANPDQPNNLWQPGSGDHGARGRFSAGAYEHSVQLWATTHRGWLALAGAALAAGAICASAARRRRRHGLP